MDATGWYLLPHFILRSTGFPFQLIAQLSFAESASAVDRLLDLEEERGRVRGALSDAVRRHLSERGPDPVDSQWGAVYRTVQERIKRDRPVDLSRGAVPPAYVTELLQRWNGLCEAREAALSAARIAFERELDDRREKLRDLAAGALFGEACFLSSPQMYLHGVRTYLRDWRLRRTSELKRLERQLISYLQRVCCKNETTSFFGPIQYGQVASSIRGIEYSAQPGVARREAFLAYWGAQALAARIGAEPAAQPFLRPRRHSLCTEEAPGRFQLHTPQGSKALELGQAGRLLSLADGSRTVSELRALLLKEDWAPDQFQSALASLQKAGLLRVQLELPVTDLRPLQSLSNWIEALPQDCEVRGAWLPELERLEDLTETFARLPLPDKDALLSRIEAHFHRLTGMDPRRKGGELYADRLLVYEEALGALGMVRMGADLFGSLAGRLSPILSFGAACGLERQRELQGRVRRLFDEMSPDGSPIPYIRLLGASDRIGIPAEVQSHEEPQPLRRLRQLVGEQSSQRAVHLNPAEFVPAETDLAGDGLVVSPDILLMAPDADAVADGRFELVFGESHDTAMLWGWALAFHPDAATVTSSVAEALASVPARGVLTNVLSSKRVKIVPFDYPGPTIEIQAASGSSPDERIPLGEVWVERRGEELVLTVPQRGLTLQLFNGELDNPVHGAFALPRCKPPNVEVGEHTPRIVVGDVVYQRERWRLQREALLPGTYSGSSFELFLDFRRLARRHGFPTYMYVRTSNERKPFFLDTTNYFLLEMLDHLLKPGEEAVLTEMLPGPDALWLDKGDGRYCSEFRFCAFHRGLTQQAGHAHAGFQETKRWGSEAN